MDLTAFMKRYAEEIGGQYTEYNSAQSIVIVPVSAGRFQTVIGNIRKSEASNRKLIALSSRVAPITPDLDFKKLVEQTSSYSYARFVIREDHLEVEAVAGFENAVEDEIREMTQEVAKIADQYEMRLTGADVY